MNKFFYKLYKIIVLWKVYLLRMLGYVQFFNLGMLLYLTLSDLTQYGININMKIWFIPIMLLSVILLIVGGLIEDKTKVFSQEMKTRTERNPQMMEMLKILRKLENDR